MEWQDANQWMTADLAFLQYSKILTTCERSVGPFRTNFGRNVATGSWPWDVPSFGRTGTRRGSSRTWTTTTATTPSPTSSLETMVTFERRFASTDCRIKFVCQCRLAEWRVADNDQNITLLMKGFLRVVCLDVCESDWVCLCMFLCVYVCMCVYVCVCVYVCMCICVCVYVCMCVCVHS